MTQRTNQWKLGAFVLASIATAVGAFFWIGAARLSSPSREMVTYFDESVQGLDEGAPVKMRGVTIGQVQRITIARDQRLVRVIAKVFLNRLERSGLMIPDEGQGAVPEGLRTQLSTTGITGEKFLLVDFFQTPSLAPVVDELNPEYFYIPSTSSTLKGIEDTFNSLADRLPMVLDRLEDALMEVSAGLAEADFSKLVDRLDSLLAEAERQLAGLRSKELVDDMTATLAEFRAASVGLREVLAHVIASDGPLERVVASVDTIAVEAADFTTIAGRAIDAAELDATTASLRSAATALEATGVELEGTLRSVSGLADDARALPPELSASLLEFRRALRSIERLADLLERQPGALLRGRAGESQSPDK